MTHTCTVQQMELTYISGSDFGQEHHYGTCKCGSQVCATYQDRELTDFREMVWNHSLGKA